MSRARRPRERRDPRASRTIRRGLLLGCFMLAGSAIVAKAARLQVVEHDRWLAAAEDQHRERVEVPARRGAILDRNGVPLALSHEMYQVSVAPSELRDREAAATALAGGLGLSARDAARAVADSRRWVVLPGRYTADQRRKVGSMRGIYFERHFDRFYPQGDAGREVIGAVTRDGRSLGGMEQQLDELLRGTPGYAVLRREARGEARPAISLPVQPPVDGASVHLTIDFDVQAIADAALREAIETTGARGGDLLISDPRTGEILAAVSRRAGRTRSLTAITEPFEPGSTLKPFLVASLLAEGAAGLTDVVYAEEGVWRDGSRTFRDTSPHDWLSLADALQVSSNIALVKFAQRLSIGQQYSYLRDFGFGTPTGIDYPAESSGRLRRPGEWSRMSSGSLAMGYEVAVTPLQMLAAYGALANGGTLMEPYLVREIRGPDGGVLARTSPSALRQVIPEDVAHAVTEVLASVVEGGTATRAALSTFAVAGKTGTARRTAVGAGYEAGAYTSTFGGYFPARDPQIVVFVKLDEPRGAYYGGLVAAPVTRETLQGILAARVPGLDRRMLLATRAEATPTLMRSPPAAQPAPEYGGGGTYVFLLEDGPPARLEPERGRPVTVPELTGLPVRDAIRRAHAAGLQVTLSGAGAGSVLRTLPAAGEQLRRGDTLSILRGQP